MATLTPQFYQLLESEDKEVFFQTVDQQPARRQQLFESRPLARAYDDGIRIGGLGTFAVKPEGTPIAFDDPVQGTQKRIVVTTYALGWRRTMEMMADDQFGIMSRMSSEFGLSAADHQERIAWDLINDGFTGTRHTVLEGETLFSTTHSLIKSGGTQSNMLSPAVPLGVTGIEAMMTLGDTCLGMEGRYITNPANGTLLVHPQERHNAYVLLNTEQRVGGNNNDRSTVVSSRSGLTPMEVPHLTSTTAWYIFNRGKSLVWYDRMSLEMSSAVDADTKDLKSYAVYRAAVASWTWEHAYASNA